MGNFKKGIKGQLTIPFNDDSKKNVEENLEVFKAVIARDFYYAKFEVYEGICDEIEVFGIDFDIMNHLSKTVNSDFIRFKKEIENHFGYKPKEIVIAKYDKVS